MQRGWHSYGMEVKRAKLFSRSLLLQMTACLRFSLANFISRRLEQVVESAHQNWDQAFLWKQLHLPTSSALKPLNWT